MNSNKTTFNDVDSDLYEKCKEFIPSLEKDDRLLDGLSLLIEEIKRNMDSMKDKI